MKKRVNVKERPLHAGQKKARLLLQPYRRKVYICGRRWGKTTEIRNLALRVLAPYNWRIALFCPEFKDIEETWKTVVKIFEDINAACKAAKQKPRYQINKTSQTVHLITPEGTDAAPCFECWSLANANKKDSGRGRKYNMVIYEETQKIDSDVLEYHYNSVARATLLDYKNSLCYFFLTPPNSKQHYSYELICRGAQNNPEMRGNPDINTPKIQDDDMCAYRAVTAENPLMDKSELDKIRKTTPELVFQQEYEARCVEYGGRMFFDALLDPAVSSRVFKYKNIPFDINLDTYLSIDFNKNPMAVTISQSNHPASYWATIKELSFPDGEQGNLYDICELIRKWFAAQGINLVKNGRSVLYRKLTITGDATGNTTSIYTSTNLTAYAILIKELGLTMNNLLVPPSNPKHAQAHAQCNHLLLNHPNLYIATDDCPRLVTDLKSTLCTEDKGIDKKKYDPHFADSARYNWHNFLPWPNFLPWSHS